MVFVIKMFVMCSSRQKIRFSYIVNAREAYLEPLYLSNYKKCLYSSRFDNFSNTWYFWGVLKLELYFIPKKFLRILKETELGVFLKTAFMSTKESLLLRVQRTVRHFP